MSGDEKVTGCTEPDDTGIDAEGLGLMVGLMQFQSRDLAYTTNQLIEHHRADAKMFAELARDMWHAFEDAEVVDRRTEARFDFLGARAVSAINYLDRLGEST